MDVILQRFYMELRKANGEEYEPNCLLVMMASLDRYLTQEKGGCVCVWGGIGEGGLSVCGGGGCIGIATNL